MSIFNMPLITWRLRSARNASIYDTRIRVALGFLFLLNLAIGIWSSGQLLQRLHQWQMQGPLALKTGLWFYCLVTWSGMSAFSILGARQAVSDDEAVLVFTLPIPPGTRFRTLFALFFIKNQWYLMLLQLSVTSYVLISVLGWQAWLWLLLLQLGIVFSVLCGLLVSLLVMGYLLPRGRTKARIGTALASGSIFLLVVLTSSHIVPGTQTFLLELRPEEAIVLLGLLLVGALGPLAASANSLYSATFTTLQGQDRSRRALTLPGISALKRLFERRRSLTAALFARAVARQSRSLYFWVRLAAILIFFALFPLIRSAVAHFEFSDTFLVAIYASGLAIVHVLEQGPGAISGEGNRLAIYLTAPYTLSQILRAKLAVLLLPVLVEGMVMSLFLSWRTGLMLSQLGFVVVAVMLMIVSCITLLVLGSAWDEDLDLAVEGAAQELLQEETPMTPRRIALLNLCLFCFGIMFVLLWKLPPLVALPALMVLTASILLGMWRFSCAHLYSLLRN